MKAFTISPKAKIHVYKEPIKMVYSFGGLGQMIKADGKDPFNGDLYLFINSAKNYVKVFHYHQEGACIYAKQIPKGVFDTTDKKQLSIKELQNLIDRVIVNGGKKLPHLKAA